MTVRKKTTKQNKKYLLINNFGCGSDVEDTFELHDTKEELLEAIYEYCRNDLGSFENILRKDHITSLLEEIKIFEITGFRELKTNVKEHTPATLTLS